MHGLQYQLVMTNLNIHTRYIPIGYAFIWGIGLVLSLFGLSIFNDNNHSVKFIYLFSAYCVFLIFLGEVFLSFVDTASIHEKDRIKGTVFWLFARFFAIIILTLVVSFCFYEFEQSWLLLLLVGIMCWLKWETSNLNNNMDKYVIKEEGLKFIANRFKIQ